MGGLRCSFGAQLERAALRLGLQFGGGEVPAIPSAFGHGGRSLGPKWALERMAEWDREVDRDPGHLAPLVAYYGAAAAAPDEIRPSLGALGNMAFVAVFTPSFRAIARGMPKALTNLDVVARMDRGHPLLTLCRAQADVFLRRSCKVYLAALEEPRGKHVPTHF